MKSLREIAKKSSLSLEDLVAIDEAILQTGYMTHEKALAEIEHFAVDLGLDDYYFKTTTTEEMVRHLIAISASQLVSKYSGVGVGIDLINEESDRALYIVEETKIHEIEDRIESKYPNFRVESYRTLNPAIDRHLRLYIVNSPDFQKDLPDDTDLTFEQAASQSFLQARESDTLQRYKEAWDWMNNREAPYIAISEKPDTQETRVMVGIHGGGTRQFMAKFTIQMRKHHLISIRKYKEPFADEKNIYTFYYHKLEQEVIEDFSREINTIVMLPEHPITELFASGVFSSQAAMYAISAAAFANQFITVLTDEYTTLSRALKEQPEAKGILDKIKLRLVKDTFTESKIAQVVSDNNEIIALLYQDFANRLHPRKGCGDKDIKAHVEQIQNIIETEVSSSSDKAILQYFLVFNELVLRTNFFRRDKICAVYRLDPSFLNQTDYPEKPFGIFFLCWKALCRVSRSFSRYRSRRNSNRQIQEFL